MFERMCAFLFFGIAWAFFFTHGDYEILTIHDALFIALVSGFFILLEIADHLKTLVMQQENKERTP